MYFLGSTFTRNIRLLHGASRKIHIIRNGKINTQRLLTRQQTRHISQHEKPSNGQEISRIIAGLVAFGFGGYVVTKQINHMVHLYHYESPAPLPQQPTTTPSEEDKQLLEELNVLVQRLTSEEDKQLLEELNVLVQRLTRTVKKDEKPVKEDESDDNIAVELIDDDIVNESSNQDNVDESTSDDNVDESTSDDNVDDSTSDDTADKSTSDELSSNVIAQRSSDDLIDNGISDTVITDDETMTIASGDSTISLEPINIEPEPVLLEDDSSPPQINLIPSSVEFVIVGAGTASHAACRGILKNKPDAKILVIGEEAHLPYMRPPLSKDLWFSDDPEKVQEFRFKNWNGNEQTIFFQDQSKYVTPADLASGAVDGGVAVLTGVRVTSIDAEEHQLQLATGDTVTYGKLLLAPGGQPNNLPMLRDGDAELKKRTTLFRTANDFQVLYEKVRSLGRVVVIGGGFLGSELAYALANLAAIRSEQAGASPAVTQLYPEAGNMARVLPRYLSEWTTEKMKKGGVNIVPNVAVSGVKLANDQLELSLSDGNTIAADHAIICTGITPDTELAQSAGLEIDPELKGFRVNSELEARSDIYVAGDAACFYDAHLGRRRVEHHDHAVVSGRLAGENMTGAKKQYKHQSMFWSDLGPDVGYEAIGIVDSSLPTVAVFAKGSPKETPKAVVGETGESIRSKMEAHASVPESNETSHEIPSSSHQNEEFGKGVIFYMKEKRVVGVMLWNVFNRMPIARRVIAESREHDDQSLHQLAREFNIHQPHPV